MKKRNIKIETAFEKLESKDWKKALSGVDDLTANPVSPAILKRLIRLLKHDSVDARNAAALALREIGDQMAVEPLLVEIFNPENTNNRSTFVYALETLDCSSYFWEIFQLAVADKADVRMSALKILFEQEFWIFQVDEIERARVFLNEHRDAIAESVWYDLHNLLNEFSSSS